MRPFAGGDIQYQGWEYIVQSGFLAPGIDAGQMNFDVTGLSDQVRQLLCEINRMLTGATPDLENPAAAGELPAQDSQNGRLVFFTGFGVLLH